LGKKPIPKEIRRSARGANRSDSEGKRRDAESGFLFLGTKKTKPDSGSIFFRHPSVPKRKFSGMTNNIKVIAILD
jgi:hypothetical protein